MVHIRTSKHTMPWNFYSRLFSSGLKIIYHNTRNPVKIENLTYQNSLRKRCSTLQNSFIFIKIADPFWFEWKFYPHYHNLWIISNMIRVEYLHLVKNTNSIEKGNQILKANELFNALMKVASRYSDSHATTKPEYKRIVSYKQIYQNATVHFFVDCRTIIDR